MRWKEKGTHYVREKRGRAKGLLLQCMELTGACSLHKVRLCFCHIVKALRRLTVGDGPLRRPTGCDQALPKLREEGFASPGASTSQEAF